MINYRTLIIAEFQKSFEEARSNGMTSLSASSVVEHPLLKDTLKCVEGKTETVDALWALSSRADELQEIAAADRTSPEWGDIFTAMGAVQNVGAELWVCTAMGIARSVGAELRRA